MKPVYSRPYRLDQSRAIYLGWSSWDDKTAAVKFAWPTASGAIARGGEMPLDAVPDVVAISTEHGWLTWDEIFAAVLADCPTPEAADSRALTMIEALLRERTACAAKVKPVPPTSPASVEVLEA